jgi:hypothetical protein
MRMRKTCRYLLAAALCMSGVSAANPGCANQSAKQCVGLALDAMGGREHLQQVQSVRLHTIAHTLLMEQSYRQVPFITSYERGQVTYDLANQRVLKEAKLTWPEADARRSDSDSIWWLARTVVLAAPRAAIRLAPWAP